MKRNIGFVLYVLLLAGCTKDEIIINPKNETMLVKLNVQPSPDTLILNPDGATSSLTLNGSYSERVSNSGVIITSEYLQTTAGNSSAPVSASAASWYSSNTSVATVTIGVVSSHAPGLAYVWAKYNDVYSDSVCVSVRVGEIAPSLSIDPPDAMLIFRDTLTISGAVGKYARLEIAELFSGTVMNNLSYGSDGKFQQTIVGFSQGIKLYSISAVHPTRSNLRTTKLKLIAYYSYGSIGADSITGQWKGECKGRPINFIVSKNQYVPRYDITGVIDIEFLNYGVIQGVNLIGAVNSDGTMNLAASKSYNGFTISGTLTGLFRNTGTADGSITAKIEKSGWPSASFQESWWAVKQ